MMEGFSGTLRLTDLNDFIAPTQECIKPVKIERAGGKAGSIKITSTGEYTEVDAEGTETKLAKAEITLNDCLACSGCVTSAETVLIQQQSTDELIRILDQNAQVPVQEKKFIVLSVSDQSLASIATRYGLSMRECQQRLTGLFKSMGVHKVFDLGVASALSLLESREEFLERMANREIKGALPMFASACPGWICYAEKTHGSFILPFISSTKSPQQIMGSLVKHYLSTHSNKTPNEVFHVSLMMCYDKKLEASRDDFYDDVYRTRDVDLVITSVEVEKMLEKRLVDLRECTLENVDVLPNFEQYSGHYGSGAGGYLESIFRYAAQQLFHKDVDRVEYKTVRNQDLREVTLEIDGQPKLRFAAAYGFRNIQNIVQKMKRGKCPYDFVEIMACPSACLNGGGQIRAPDTEVTKDWLDKVQTRFLEYENQDLLKPAASVDAFDLWLEGKNSPKRKEFLHTQYHSLENNTFNLNIKW
ncbi:cytosolic Fe-S cluster assembly factor narfl-like [Paramacrobiotus metropolitanus]|uniref:cytosolic Fe-S cluster assembly factor narfl-like n=1 Tax=Paramacrobiotus metropolitanus TaxID=2943436 RepID=UPI002445BBE6|nr:cytosolic Fe-S cluster assembly factor narfl-like [Paramacrobiotus metropolitanus]